MEAIGDLRKEILENRQQITNINSSLTAIVSSVEMSVNSIKELQNSHTSLVKENEILKREIRNMNKKDRRNNLIIFNVPNADESGRNALPRKIITILSEANITINDSHIDDCYRIGRQSQNRPVLLKLSSYLKKREIFESRSDLFKMGYRISFDNSKEEREEYRNAQPYIIHLRKTNRSARFRDGKILVENKLYTLEEVKKVLEGEESQSRVSGRLERFAFRSRSSSAGSATRESSPPLKKKAV